MPLTFKKSSALLRGVCAIEEAEALLAWLSDNPKGKVNLRDCEHLHTALVQVLMAARPTVSALPRREPLASFLATILAVE